MAKLVRSGEHKTFLEIKRLFTERQEALRFFYTPNNMNFFGRSETELMERLSYHLQEAEYDASLALFAAIEAALRLDIHYRHEKRLKDLRSRRIRELLNRPRGRSNHDIEIDEIIKTLKIGASVSQRSIDRIISRLQEYFKYRHWLAHGRYWKRKQGSCTPTFSDIYRLAQEIEKVL